jgi:thioredoxin 1
MSTTLIVMISIVIFIVAYLFFNIRRIKKIPEVANSTRIKVLTDKNFLNQIKKGTVLVDFWASWCLPCKMMSPVLNDVAEELTGNRYVGKLNVEHYQSVAARYNIRNIPTMVLFSNGREIDRFVGAKSKEFLLNKIIQNK